MDEGRQTADDVFLLSIHCCPWSELFCCQNSTNDLGHHQFAVAVEPLLCNSLDLADQRFILIFAIKHGCPQFAVFAQRSTDVVNERRNFREGEVILKFVQFGLGKNFVNRVEYVALET